MVNKVMQDCSSDSEIWSCFQKSKKASSPVIRKVLSEPYVIFHEKPYTMLLDVLLSFVKLCDPSEMLFMLSRS